MNQDFILNSVLKIFCKNCHACCVDLVVELLPEDLIEWEENGLYDSLIDSTEFNTTFETDFLEVRTLKQKDDGSCIFLINGLCSIYEFRPKVCRDFEYFGQYCKIIRERNGFCSIEE